MRTGLVVLGYNGHLVRANTGEESTVRADVPTYAKSEKVTGHVLGGVDRRYTKPAGVRYGYNQFPTTKIAKHVRHLPEIVSKALDVLDANREMVEKRLAELQEQEKAILTAAFATATPVTMAEVKRWTRMVDKATAERKAKAIPAT